MVVALLSVCAKAVAAVKLTILAITNSSMAAGMLVGETFLDFVIAYVWLL
jgi:hypothetical protein